MARLRPSALLFMCLVFAASTVTAAPEGDARVKKRLDARSMKYEVYEDGDFKLTFSYKQDNRSQLVFVSGTTESVGAFEIREIFAPALKLTDYPLSGAKTKALLESSGEYKLGSWEIRDEVLYYVIKLPDSVDAEELESALEIAAEAADDMELELSGKDDL
ncbi:MAG: hypothetical protein ACOVKN_09665 [Arenimonas sp.]|jgi:hypothetical protein